MAEIWYANRKWKNRKIFLSTTHKNSVTVKKTEFREVTLTVYSFVTTARTEFVGHSFERESVEYCKYMMLNIVKDEKVLNIVNR